MTAGFPFWFLSGIVGLFLIDPHWHREIQQNAGWEAVGLFLMVMVLAGAFGPVILLVGIVKALIRHYRP